MGDVPKYMRASQPSAYHETCIPKKPVVAEPTQNYTQGDYVQCDQVSQDKIWKQAVEKEWSGKKEWEANWGFLTEFDAKGEAKEKEEKPDKISLFSDDVPNTNSGNYGSRNNTETGLTIQDLEHRFYAKQRRRRMDNDLLCY